MRNYKDQTEARSVDFLRRLSQAAPMKIVEVLTDNGSQFTDRFTTRSKMPSAQVFEQTRFASANELELTLTQYAATYNQHIPHRVLNYLTPTQA